MYKNFEERIFKYFYLDYSGSLIFDEEHAIKDDESQEFIELAYKILELSKIYENYETNLIEANDKRLLLYGNWCGPNYGSGIPIDNLDRGCRKHDLCYANPRYGSHNCKCDNDFLRYIIDGQSKGIFTPGSERTMSYTIRGWLAIKTRIITENGGALSCRT